jgi:hypothetical protein
VKFSSVVFIQIFSVKNANPSIYEIHVKNGYFPLPSKFEMVRRAWMKQVCAKVRNMFTRALVLHSVGQLMYLSNTPDEKCPPVGPNDVPRNWSVLDWAKESYNSLKHSILAETNF